MLALHMTLALQPRKSLEPPLLSHVLRPRAQQQSRIPKSPLLCFHSLLNSLFHSFAFPKWQCLYFQSTVNSLAKTPGVWARAMCKKVQRLMSSSKGATSEGPAGKVCAVSKPRKINTYEKSLSKPSAMNTYKNTGLKLPLESTLTKKPGATPLLFRKLDQCRWGHLKWIFTHESLVAHENS